MAEEKKDLGKPIGEITNYFEHVGVAAIKLSAGLKSGDKVHIVGGEDTDFEQDVGSMQIQHKKIEKAKKGDEIGLKVDEKVRKGYKVYKA
jgi:putative protease